MSLLTKIILLGLIGVVAALDGSNIDARLEKELETPKIMYMDKIKKNLLELEAAGAPMDQIVKKPYRGLLINKFLENLWSVSSDFEKESYAKNRKDYKKGDFELALEVANISNCRHVKEYLPTLELLNGNQKLQSEVSKDTLLWWKVLNACNSIIDEVNNGHLTDEVYNTFMKNYKPKQNSFGYGDFSINKE